MKAAVEGERLGSIGTRSAVAMVVISVLIGLSLAMPTQAAESNGAWVAPTVVDESDFCTAMLPRIRPDPKWHTRAEVRDLKVYNSALKTSRRECAAGLATSFFNYLDMLDDDAVKGRSGTATEMNEAEEAVLLPVAYAFLMHWSKEHPIQFYGWRPGDKPLGSSECPSDCWGFGPVPAGFEDRHPMADSVVGYVEE